jgi:hypothetical protein
LLKNSTIGLQNSHHEIRPIILHRFVLHLFLIYTSHKWHLRTYSRTAPTHPRSNPRREPRSNPRKEPRSKPRREPRSNSRRESGVTLEILVILEEILEILYDILRNPQEILKKFSRNPKKSWKNPWMRRVALFYGDIRSYTLSCRVVIFWIRPWYGTDFTVYEACIRPYTTHLEVGRNSCVCSTIIIVEKDKLFTLIKD